MPKRLIPMPVLLVSPPSFSPTERFFIPCNEIPLNLCYIAAYLEKNGVAADVLDLDVVDKGFSFRQHLKETKPTIVGFTSFSPFIESANRLAGEVKAWNSATVTVIGGYHASAFPEQALEEFSNFEILVCGEGEETLLELVGHFSREPGAPPSNVAGISRREDGKIIRNAPREQIADIDTLPFPAREKLPLDRYVPNPVNYLKLPTTAILASRGCRFGCTFCSKYLFKGERTRSAENIFAEIQDCGERLGIRDFRFYDDNFTYHRDACLKLCELLRTRARGVSWNCFSRVDCIDEELLTAMKSAGCYQVKYGVETGSETTLETINKRITFDQSRAAVSLAKRLGVECQISMMIGLPDETAEDMEKTIKFAIELSPDLILFNVFKPIPGSVLYKKLRKEDKLLDVKWEDFLVKSTRPVMKGAFTSEQLGDFMKRAYVSFYLRPAYFMQRLKWLFRAPLREMRRYAVAAKIFSSNIMEPSLLAFIAMWIIILTCVATDIVVLRKPAYLLSALPIIAITIAASFVWRRWGGAGHG